MKRIKVIGGALKIVRLISFEKESARKKKILRGRSGIAMNGVPKRGGKNAIGIRGRDKHIINAVSGRRTGPARIPVNEYLIKK